MAMILDTLSVVRDFASAEEGKQAVFWWRLLWSVLNPRFTFFGMEPRLSESYTPAVEVAESFGLDGVLIHLEHDHNLTTPVAPSVLGVSFGR